MRGGGCQGNTGCLCTRGERAHIECGGGSQREADEVVVVPLHQKGAIREWLSHRMPFADQRPEAPVVFPSQWETRLGVSIALQCWYNFLKGQ